MNEASHRTFKDALYQQFARVAKALASPRRLELIDLLSQGERTVEELAAESNTTVANASQHLQKLRAAGLVSARRQGRFVHYRLADEQVERTWLALRALAEAQLADIAALPRPLADETAPEPVGIAELQARLARDNVTLIDVRPAREYRAGHLPGARSIPLAELSARLAELPRDREIIAYCRGPYCLFADEAVALLGAHGYRARRLAVGLPEWRAAGLAVEA